MNFVGKGAALSTEGFLAAADMLNVKAAKLWAVFEIEAKGCGFNSDRRPVILFERHWFHRRTEGRFSAAHPDVSSSAPGGYGRSSAQHDRLQRAMQLDADAAIYSTSWGLGQLMGFNAGRGGFASMHDMIARMVDAEDEQLFGMARFIASDRVMWKALQVEDWAAFAKRYNGANFAINSYDIRLRAAHRKYLAGPLPDLEVREAQLLLTYLDFGPLKIDGWSGPVTMREVDAFLDGEGQGPVRTIDDDVLALLRARVDATTV